MRRAVVLLLVLTALRLGAEDREYSYERLPLVVQGDWTVTRESDNEGLTWVWPIAPRGFVRSDGTFRIRVGPDYVMFEDKSKWKLRMISTSRDPSRYDKDLSFALMVISNVDSRGLFIEHQIEKRPRKDYLMIRVLKVTEWGKGAKLGRFEESYRLWAER